MFNLTPRHPRLQIQQGVDREHIRSVTEPSMRRAMNINFNESSSISVKTIFVVMMLT